MRRAPALREVSRRDFCAFACLGAAGAAFAGCFGGGSGAVETGGLDGTDGTGDPHVDASTGVIHPDGGSGSGSGSGSGAGPTCSGTYLDVGAPASFVLNTPKLFGSPNYFFVVRDASGLYALSSKCTHQGVALTPSSTKFHCNAHGADFTLNGAVIDGPISSAKVLVHYSMCFLANGNVGVQKSMVVAATTRLVA